VVSFLAFDHSGGAQSAEEKAKNRFSREGLSFLAICDTFDARGILTSMGVCRYPRTQCVFDQLIGLPRLVARLIVAYQPTTTGLKMMPTFRTRMETPSTLLPSVGTE
jgi:hypothetical protein